MPDTLSTSSWYKTSPRYPRLASFAMASSRTTLTILQLMALITCILAADIKSSDNADDVKDIDTDNDGDDLDTQETGWLFAEKMRQLEYFKNKLLSPLLGFKSPYSYNSYGGGYPGFSSNGGNKFTSSVYYGKNSPSYYYNGGSSNYPGSYPGIGGFSSFGTTQNQPNNNQFYPYKKVTPTFTSNVWYNRGFSGGVSQPSTSTSYAPDCDYTVTGFKPSSFTPSTPNYSSGTPLYVYYSNASPTQSYAVPSSTSPSFNSATVNIPTPVAAQPSYTPQYISPGFTFKSSSPQYSFGNSQSSGPSSWASIVPSVPSAPASPSWSYVTGSFPASSSLPSNAASPSISSVSGSVPSAPSTPAPPSWSYVTASAPASPSPSSNAASPSFFSVSVPSAPSTPAPPSWSYVTASAPASPVLPSNAASPSWSSVSGPAPSAPSTPAPPSWSYVTASAPASPTLSPAPASPSWSSVSGSIPSAPSTPAPPSLSYVTASIPASPSLPSTPAPPSWSLVSGSIPSASSTPAPPSLSSVTESFPSSPSPPLVYATPSPPPSYSVSGPLLSSPSPVSVVQPNYVVPSTAVVSDQQNVFPSEEVAITPAPPKVKGHFVTTLPGPKLALPEEPSLYNPGSSYALSYYPNLFIITNEQHLESPSQPAASPQRQDTSTSISTGSTGTSLQSSSVAPETSTPSSQSSPQVPAQPVLTSYYSSNTIDQTRVPLVYPVQQPASPPADGIFYNYPVVPNAYPVSSGYASSQNPPQGIQIISSSKNVPSSSIYQIPFGYGYQTPNQVITGNTPVIQSTKTPLPGC
ncbi:hypothetical protein J6590_035345 [Homalodisca vitripennis]|nr:hypothetical protein J6590_035345 [Homalodisca vitripennis]